jgi:hypothetical protein
LWGDGYFQIIVEKPIAKVVVAKQQAFYIMDTGLNCFSWPRCYMIQYRHQEAFVGKNDMSGIRMVLVLGLVLHVVVTNGAAESSQGKSVPKATKGESLKERRQVKTPQTPTNETPDDKGSGCVSRVTGFYTGTEDPADLPRMTSGSGKGAGRVEKKPGPMLSLFGNEKDGGWDLVIGIDSDFGFGIDNKKTKFNTNSISVRKKGNFGLAPRIGYGASNSTNGYVSFGVLWARYKPGSETSKRLSTKSAMYVGLGVNQEVGSLFVRAEVDKIFGKLANNVTEAGKKSISSYVLKFGGGYRF